MVKPLIQAVRPWSFIMTIISVTLGNVLSLGQGEWSWLNYLLTLTGTLFCHAASNLLNDYFDTRYGVDAAEDLAARKRQHPILAGIFSARQILIFSIVFYAAAVGIGIVLIRRIGITILFYMLAGGAGGIFYTAGPFRYKYHALGELCVFLLWGPLLVSASYYIQRTSFVSCLPVIWISLLQGAWVSLVLFGDNLKDIDYDREKGITTIAILLGKERGMRLVMLVIILIYLGTCLLILIKLLPVVSLLTLAIVPPAIATIKQLTGAPVLPPDTAPRIARLGMLYGLFLVLTIGAGRIAFWK